MFDLQLWLAALAVLAAFAVLGWLVSLPLRNVSIVDGMWSLMFVLAAATYAVVDDLATGPRATLLLVLVTVWALRLAIYITWRNHGHGEDFRYQKIRANNEPRFELKSLYIVFGLQAALAWVISLPLLAGIRSDAPLGWLDYAGVALWAVGFVFEAGGDWQLSRFKADPANRGKVMDSGLWRYTRHPNYFGDFCIWWGFFLIALSAGGWWSVVGPALMSVLLLRVSGVALLEKDIGERRPAYREYIQRTNAFFPGPATRAGVALVNVAVRFMAAVAVALAAASAASGAASSAAGGSHPDPRTARELKFDVFLGDRAIGYQRFTLAPAGDALRIETRAQFVVKVLGLKVYEYDHRNTEVWRGNCLQTIESQTNSNGTAYRVQGRAETGAFVVDANSGERRLADCVGTFAYWDKRQLLSRTQLLNPQTGEYLPVRVRALGPSTLELGTRRVAVDRYALVGKDLDITLDYAATTGEWLGLESRIEGDRLLRYRRAEHAVAGATRGS